MSEHKPLTDDELAEWKSEAGNQIHFCATRDESLNTVEAIVYLRRLLDCIEEVNRLLAENKELREKILETLVRNHCAEMDK